MLGSVELIFAVDIGVLFILLIGATWSVANPTRRLWPPPDKHSWEYRVTWLAFSWVFALNAVLLVLDWNSWQFPHRLRFVVGIPLAAIGTLLVFWGVRTLGHTGTLGLRGELVTSGPYRFMRNPQYLGDMILFIGLSVIANSLLLWIAHVLTILVFLIAPLAEEPWLAEQYGGPYIEYMRGTSRFL